jgi:predicted RND superfamily exporter protein
MPNARCRQSFVVKIRTQSRPTVAPHHKELAMRQFFRSILTALSIACLAASFGSLSLHPALAQIGSPDQLKPIALTQAQIDNVLASQKEIAAITKKLPRNAPPSSKAMAQLEDVAKAHGFASFDEYNNVIGNISMVMDGIDPDSKKYIGSEAALKMQVDQVTANKKMSAANKKRELAYLDMALKAKEPDQNQGNVDLVVQNYDKIDAALSIH